MDLCTKILNFSPHSQKIVQALSALKQAGATSYFVGGSVRDTILNRPIQDIDIEVHGISLDDLQKILSRFEAVVLVGKSFGLLRWFESEIDWSLPRVDSVGRHPIVTIDPKLSIADALRRRDLTMNALALNADTGELIDPFGGVNDLQDKILRTPDPDRFIEDPLRFYRVLQLSARFGMEPDETLTRLCSTMNISDVAHERVAEEYNKLMLQSDIPSRGFHLLHRFKRLSVLLPELYALINLPQDFRWHPEGDVFEHTMQAIDSAALYMSEVALDRATLIYGVLCHDLGKAVTTVVTSEKISSYRHEEAGVPLARALLSRMVLGSSLYDPIARLVRWHMAPGALVTQNSPARAYKRLAMRVAPHTSLRMIGAVAHADRRGRNPEKNRPLMGLSIDIETFMGRAAEAGVLDGPEAPIITGKDLLPYVKPGPKFGEYVRHAYLIQIEKGITDPDELIKRVLR